MARQGHPGCRDWEAMSLCVPLPPEVTPHLLPQLGIGGRAGGRLFQFSKASIAKYDSR